MPEIIRPTLAGMAEEGAPFKGILYAGLMLTASGPKLIEYNVRFGDPECQVILPRLLTDLAQLLLGAVDGMLTHMSLRWRPEHALTVVMASRGYPGDYIKGTEIRGLDALEGEPGLLVFHAGTKLLPDGRLVANGGRVLGVTGLGTTLAAAQAKAYGAAERIDWPEGFYRRRYRLAGAQRLRATCTSLAGPPLLRRHSRVGCEAGPPDPTGPLKGS